LYWPVEQPVTGVFVPVQAVLGVVMLMGFSLPVPADPQLYLTVVLVVVDVDADSNEPFEDSPGVAKSTVPLVALQVMANAVAPAVPDCATEVTAVTPIAPRGIAIAEAIKSIFRSIVVVAPFG
jgi:hypothetical protein